MDAKTFYGRSRAKKRINIGSDDNCDNENQENINIPLPEDKFNSDGSEDEAMDEVDQQQGYKRSYWEKHKRTKIRFDDDLGVVETHETQYIFIPGFSSGDDGSTDEDYEDDMFEEDTDEENYEQEDENENNDETDYKKGEKKELNEILKSENVLESTKLHLPVFEKEEHKCTHCQNASSCVKCTVCNTFLCLTEEKNCFVDYHKSKE